MAVTDTDMASTLAASPTGTVHVQVCEVYYCQKGVSKFLLNNIIKYGST